MFRYLLGVLVSCSLYTIGYAEAPANIIFILVDDQGWTDLSVRMDDRVPDSRSDYYETPHLEQLASQGVRFSSGYASSPICTPTRASMLTGRSPAGMGFTDIIESRPGSRRFSDLYAGKKLIGPLPVTGFSEEEVTIAEFLKERAPAKYVTAHFGKWHVGNGGPGRHGFDVHDGSTGNAGVYANSEDPNPKDVFGLTGRAIAFMRAQVRAGRPFYMQLSHYAPHVPLHAMQRTWDKYKAKPKGERHTNALYAALTEDLDRSVGRLIEGVQQLGIEDNTYVFYVSDNGGSMNVRNSATNNAPLKKGKTWVFEGGIRVPFIVKGPGIDPGQSNTPVIGWDLFPTFCAIARCEGPLPENIEGGNLLPVLTGSAPDVERTYGESLFWHFPHYLTMKGTTPQSAMRKGRYKLVRFYHYEESHLYDLDNDIGETENLAEMLPQVLEEMDSELSAYLQSIGAGMPSKNEAYKP